MTTMASRITIGVDTHLDVHVAAALDERGGLLEVESFETTPAGYAKLLAWAGSFGELELAGVEGTGSYGAGLTRHLHANNVPVVEVDRPNRQRRRLRGKSDPQDAISAARAAQGGDATSIAKTRDGNVESLRVLRVARCSARKAKAQALNQMRSLVSTAPDEIRAELRRTTGKQLVARCSRFRHTGRTDPASVTKITLRSLARRFNDLTDEIAELDALIKPLVNDTAPALAELIGVGTEIASAILVAAGDNPERLRNEATFAHLCGVAPIDASSGKQERHRLNRGGDRQANSALWRIVITRLVYDPRTREYFQRRTKEGLSKKETIRCLKRYVARDVFNALPRERLA